MSWFHESMPRGDTHNHATAAEVVACFQNERPLLNRLAFLITGDQATADQSLVDACDITLKGSTPFRDWLLEWAKVATISSAISRQAMAIRACEDTYKNERCSHVGHLPQAHKSHPAASLKLILEADSGSMIAELDPLCRAVLVLTLAMGSSIQDCVLRLNVCRAAVLAATSRAMGWLQQSQSPSHGESQMKQSQNHVPQPDSA